MYFEAKSVAWFILFRKKVANDLSRAEVIVCASALSVMPLFVVVVVAVVGFFPHKEVFTMVTDNPLKQIILFSFCVLLYLIDNNITKDVN